MKMRKIYILMAAVLAGALAFSSCVDENETTFQEPTTFVLNTPSMVNGVYDLANTDYFELTCSQPDYGYTAGVTYSVQVSLENDFSTEGKYADLSTTYTTPLLAIGGNELASTLCELYSTEEDDYPITTTVYFRAKAVLTESGLGEIYSNVVSVTAKLEYTLADAEAPAAMYFTGSFTAGNSWGTWVTLHPVYSWEGAYYAVVYMEAGSEFKISPTNAWDGDMGYNQITLTDDADAGLGAAGTDDGSNLVISNAGWYTLFVEGTISGASISYELIVLEAYVGAIGAAEGSNWSTGLSPFTAPDDASGEWVSSPFTGSGELRMYVDCTGPGASWWQTEFTIYKPDYTLCYRDDDHNCDDSWSGDVGSDYSVTVDTSTTVYIDFTNGTGRWE